MRTPALSHPAALSALTVAFAAVSAAVHPALATPLLADISRPAAAASCVALAALAILLARDAKAHLARQQRAAGDAYVLAPLVVLAALAVASSGAALLSLVVAPLLALGAAGAVAAVALGQVYATWVRVPTEQLPVASKGQVWWAQIPFEERSGGKDRPCVVLESAGRHVVVLMCTSRDKADRAGYVPAPQYLWPGSGKQSWIRTDRRIRLDRSELRRQQGTIDEHTWRQLRLP